MTHNVDLTDVRVDTDTIDDVVSVLESGRFVKGPVLERFERQFAERVGVDHAVGVSSGTAAILLALRAADVGPGDQVFVPGHSFFATVSPVLALDAEPVFVDVDPDTYTMDPTKLAAHVEEADSPTAVIPVHIHGLMADMKEIRSIADEHGLFVLEDACQAHFAEHGDETAGAAGNAGAFSFYPTKNMTVAGDGGMVTTDDEELAEEMRQLRNHGRGADGVHKLLGLNYRLDETNAAVGLSQLQSVERWNENRRIAAERYDELLGDVSAVTIPPNPDDATHAYHLYVVQVPDRDQLRAHLDEQGIDTGIHYESALHQHPAVADYMETSELPHAERLVDRIVSLPMHPRLAEPDVEYVGNVIADYYA